MNSKKIGECDIEIIGGIIMSRIAADKDADEKEVIYEKVIIPKSITSIGIIDANELAEERLRTTDAKRRSQKGDIIIKLSTPYDAAVVDEKSEKCTVPSFCAIIRCYDKIDRNYLLAFLNSSLCKEQLKKQTAGQIMSILSVGKIKNVEIPLPSIDEQIEIGKRYMETQNKLLLIKRIEELESKRNDAVFKELIND